jgi:HemY protein
LIAASAGDAHAANRLALQAASSLTSEPLLDVLQAQAAQLKGDRAAVKKSFEQMVKNPDTEVLGLRGLFADARQSGDLAAATAHAERALSLNPRLAWASAAMLQIQSARKEWSNAARTIASQGKSGLLPRADADKRRAAMIAAQALDLEDRDRNAALSLATEAHGLDPSLVPASLVAARMHAANGSHRKAIRIIRDTWAKSPHPELAEVLTKVKPGEDGEQRYERVRDLVGETDHHVEGAYALARAAIAARRFEVAKKTLEPHIQHSPAIRLCALMADIEDALDDHGRSREWLARALAAPRDPMWVSDGVASPRWTPVSPVTGEIVPCEWKPPYDVLFMPSPLEEFAHVAAAQTSPTDRTAIALRPEEAVAVLPRLPDDPGVDQETV